MTNLPEPADWVGGIYQIEQTDPVLGGPPNLETGAGIANVQAQQLAERTAWLKAQIEAAVATAISTGTGLNGGGALGGGLTISASIATQAQAEAGLNTNGLMTPQRVKQAIDAAVNALVGAAPAQLDTLNELATAITENGDTSAALTALIATKFGTADLADQAQAEAGVSTSEVMTPLGTHQAISAALSNALPTAWVNFDGRGTVAIREAYNVSSITDLSAGVTGSTLQPQWQIPITPFLDCRGRSQLPLTSATTSTSTAKQRPTCKYSPQMFTAKLAIGTTCPS